MTIQKKVKKGKPGFHQKKGAIPKKKDELKIEREEAERKDQVLGTPNRNPLHEKQPGESTLFLRGGGGAWTRAYTIKKIQGRTDLLQGSSLRKV